MRAIYSYGVAGIIVIGVGAWLSTGTFVAGGNGPGNGERPIISLVDKDAEHGAAEHHEGPDPHLTIAQRVAETTGAAAPAQSVRTVTYQVQPMAIEVPL